MRRRILVPLAVVILTATACGPKSTGAGARYSPPPTKLSAEDFKAVCSGATVSSAKAYDKTSTTGHKAVYLETYKDGNLVDSSTELPKDWTVTYDANSNVFAGIDLVICGKRTAQTLVKNCTGYTVDKKADGLVVKWHKATYHVSVHEATTGKELAAKDIVADDAECPASEYMVPKGTTSMDDYATVPSEQIVDFAKPFAQP